jgi:hypothetical protein
MLEAQLMLATLLQRVQVDLMPGQASRPTACVTLTSGAGLAARVTSKRAAGILHEPLRADSQGGARSPAHGSGRAVPLLWSMGARDRAAGEAVPHRRGPRGPARSRRDVQLLDKILRMGEGKILRQLQAVAKQVNAIEDEFTSLSDDELRAQTDVFRQRYADGETLDDLMPEAFATVREASKRVLGQRHFDVQIMGGAALHLGNIAEMRTGEGKTLVSTLPAYLNAISGDGVHVVTVNDYLAKYHAEWMGRIHHFLGPERRA